MQPSTRNPPLLEQGANVPRRPVLGTPLCCTTYNDFAAYCLCLARQPGPHIVVFANTHIVTSRRHEPPFREVTSCVDFFIPDGMPLIWCLNARGAGLRDRVYGPTFMRQFLSSGAAGSKHYFLGGSEECVSQLKQRSLAITPQLRIVGARNGYFKPEDEAGLLSEINRLSPDFLWVGLGTPKQQQWIHRHRDRLRRGVILAVGFAFDVNAGTKPDAPAWMQRCGLEWVFRMCCEPRRLIPRYCRYNSLFIFYLLWDGLRGRALPCGATNGSQSSE